MSTVVNKFFNVRHDSDNDYTMLAVIMLVLPRIEDFTRTIAERNGAPKLAFARNSASINFLLIDASIKSIRASSKDSSLLKIVALCALIVNLRNSLFHGTVNPSCITTEHASACLFTCLALYSYIHVGCPPGACNLFARMIDENRLCEVATNILTTKLISMPSILEQTPVRAPQSTALNQSRVCESAPNTSQISFKVKIVQLLRSLVHTPNRDRIDELLLYVQKAGFPVARDWKALQQSMRRLFDKAMQQSEAVGERSLLAGTIAVAALRLYYTITTNPNISKQKIEELKPFRDKFTSTFSKLVTRWIDSLKWSSSGELYCTYPRIAISSKLTHLYRCKCTSLSLSIPLHSAAKMMFVAQALVTSISEFKQLGSNLELRKITRTLFDNIVREVRLHTQHEHEYFDFNWHLHMTVEPKTGFEWILPLPHLLSVDSCTSRIVIPDIHDLLFQLDKVSSAQQDGTIMAIIQQYLILLRKCYTTLNRSCKYVDQAT